MSIRLKPDGKSFLNRERALEMMEKYNLDALIATTPENVTYLTDFISFTRGQYGCERKSYAVLPRDTSIEPWMIVVASDVYMFQVNLDRLDTWMNDVQTYDNLKKDPDYQETKYFMEAAVEKLVTSICEKKLDKCNLGIDEMDLTPAAFETIQNRLPRAKLVPAYSIFKEIRIVKSPKEIEILGKAVSISEKALKGTFDKAYRGMSREEFALTYNELVVRQGDGITPVPRGNVRSQIGCLRFGYTPKFRLEDGQTMLLDCGCFYRGYQADTARTAIFGTVTDKQRRQYDAIYNPMLEAQQTAIENIRAGVHTSAIYKIGSDVLKKYGSKARFSGHGVDMAVHTPPFITEGVDSVLEKNMVVNVECSMFRIEQDNQSKEKVSQLPTSQERMGYFLVEDTMVVLENGVRYLTFNDRNLYSK